MSFYNSIPVPNNRMPELGLMAMNYMSSLNGYFCSSCLPVFENNSSIIRVCKTNNKLTVDICIMSYGYRT